MMADGACGIDFELIRASEELRLVAENDLGGGRAADIAETDE